MSLLCQSCGQHPFPLRSWKEQIDGLSKAYHNVYAEEFRLAESIADNITAYIEILLREQEIANKALESARAFSAPISKVSDDILICIFQELFSTETESEAFVFATPGIHQYTLVCKRWRSIITSVPRFWTKVYIPPSSPKETASLRQFIHAQTEYAGALPLEVVCFNGLTKSSLDMLRPALGRITTLHASPSYSESKETLTTCSLLPKLSRFHLDLFETDSIATSDSDSDFGIDTQAITVTLPRSNAPFLTAVELESGLYLEGITLPWAQLTSLKLSLWSGGNFDPCSIVTELDKIEKLELDLGSSFVHPPINGRLHITLPHLRTISLTGYKSYDFPFQLLQHSDLPSLKELNFRLVDGHREFVDAMNNPKIWAAAKLKLGFGRYFGHRHSPGEVEEVMNSLWGFKSLQTFSCYVNKKRHSIDRIFGALSRDDPSRGFLFPHLQSLKITGAYFTDRAIDSMQTLLQSRVSRVGAPIDTRKALKTVQVSFMTPPSFNSAEAVTKQVYKPTQYNDVETSTSIEIEGRLPADFLEENLADLFL